MRKAGLFVFIVSLAVLASLSVINMLAAADHPRIRAIAEMHGDTPGFYVIALGVAMPLDRFLVEVGPVLARMMWPLLLIASVVQISALWYSGALRSNSAYRALFAILLAAPVALIVRVLFYTSGLPDFALFDSQSQVVSSQYSLRLSSLSAVVVGYVLLTLSLVPNRTVPNASKT